MKIYEVAFQLNEPHFLTGFYYSQDIDTACGCAFSYTDMIAKNYKLKDLQRSNSFLYIREFETDKPFSFFKKLNDIFDNKFNDEQIAFFKDYESGVISHTDLLTLSISNMTEWQYEFLVDFVAVGTAFIDDNISGETFNTTCTTMFKNALYPVEYSKDDLTIFCHALNLVIEEIPAEVPELPLNFIAYKVEEMVSLLKAMTPKIQ